MDLLDQIASQTGAALVTITHDLAVAARAERQYRLAEGVLVPISLDTTSEWWATCPSSPTGPPPPSGGSQHPWACRGRAGPGVTGVVGAIVEAWGELRIHKHRCCSRSSAWRAPRPRSRVSPPWSRCSTRRSRSRPSDSRAAA